jgi:iron complex outermembrane receptor protein
MRKEMTIEKSALSRFLVQCVLTMLLLVIAGASSPGAYASADSAIRGRVTDESGARVAGALVRLRSRSVVALIERTDRQGAYAFEHLGTGDYVLEVLAEGFATQTSERLHLAPGQTVTLDLKLSVATVNESVVVTATGTPQRIDEVSKAVTILQDQEIEARRELTLAEALRGTPGLRVQQQGSPGALTTLRLRGQRAYDTALLLDGLRVRDASDINGSAIPLIADLSPQELERVEILRGSGSSIYGTNAIGGVINLVPQVGAGPIRFEAGFEGGSLALFRERLKASGGVGRRAGFSFGLTRTDVRRGIDGQDQYGNTAGAGRFQFNATPAINISANFYGTLANARLNDSPFALPAAFTSAERFPRAEAGVTFQPDFNNPDQGRRNRLLVGAVRLTHNVNETFSYALSYQRVQTRRRNYNGPAIDPRYAAFYPFGDFEFINVNNGLTDTFDGRANLRLGRANLVTAGFEFERESLFQQSIPSFSGFNKTTDRQRTFAIFGQDQLFLFGDRLQISLGARQQFYRISEADRPGFLSGVTAESSLTGDGSVAYFIRSTGTKLRAHVGNGFRAPSLFERFGAGTFAQAGFVRFGDPTLRAEQSISADGGFDQRLSHDRLIFGATYFYTHLQRIVGFTGFASDPLGLGRFGGYVNGRGGLSRGVESYLETRPFRGGAVRASYTFTNSATQLAQREYVIPRHLFGLAYNQRYRSLLWSVDVNRTGAYIAPVFENNFPFGTANLRFEGYTKADAFMSYERSLTERLTVTLYGGAENIFNQDYFENGFRAPGATGRGGVKLRF